MQRAFVITKGPKAWTLWWPYVAVITLGFRPTSLRTGIVYEQEVLAVGYRGGRLARIAEYAIAKTRAVGMFFLLASTLVATALGQSRSQAGPAPAASAASFAVSAGYSYLTMPIPGAARVNLNGLTASGNVDLAPHGGAAVDTSYFRASGVLGTGHNSYVLSFLVGPVFYPVERRNARVFLHVLAGAGLVDSAVPVRGVHYLGGWVTRFSDAAGGGVERSVSGPFALRVSADYLRTTFVDSAGVTRPQNNLRATVGLVFHLRQLRD